MPLLTDEELRFEIQKQMGDCVLLAARTDDGGRLGVKACWPDGASYTVMCRLPFADGNQSIFIKYAVSRLTAWREIQLLEGAPDKPSAEYLALLDHAMRVSPSNRGIDWSKEPPLGGATPGSGYASQKP